MAIAPILLSGRQSTQNPGRVARSEISVSEQNKTVSDSLGKRLSTEY
jgi:hypothetical protein